MPPRLTFLLVALAFAVNTATASTQHSLNLLRGSEVAIGAELGISDAWVGYGDPKLSFQESIIRVGLKNEHTDLIFSGTSQTWQVEYTITLVPVTGQGATYTNQTLEITYEPTGGTYTSEAVLDYHGYRAATIELTSVSPGGALPTGLVFTVELIQQMRYDVDTKEELELYKEDNKPIPNDIFSSPEEKRVI